MAWPWPYSVEQLPEGDFRLTVPGLADFEVFAETEAQVLAEWMTALRSHLAGYLSVGKVIPLPSYHLVERPEMETSTGSRAHVVFLSEGLQVMPGDSIADPLTC